MIWNQSEMTLEIQIQFQLKETPSNEWFKKNLKKHDKSNTKLTINITTIII